jgi:hypothetical protein
MLILLILSIILNIVLIYWVRVLGRSTGDLYALIRVIIDDDDYNGPTLKEAIVKLRKLEGWGKKPDLQLPRWLKRMVEKKELPDIFE